MHSQIILVILAGFASFLSEGQGQRECKDRFRYCHIYSKAYCFNKRYRTFMEKRCAQYCGFCDCNNWVFGCCRDRKTKADGPNEQGCAIKLCYDEFVDGCPKFKKNGRCTSSSPQIRSYMKKSCPYSCGFCKHLAPSKSQCLFSKFGCCWDGEPALGPHYKGCRPCADTYPHTCKQFAVPGLCSSTGAYYTRTFLEDNCPRICGVCPEAACHDKARKSKCMRWFYKGYCDESIWKPYMMDNCAKTCEVCKEKSIIV